MTLRRAGWVTVVAVLVASLAASGPVLGSPSEPGPSTTTEPASTTSTEPPPTNTAEPETTTSAPDVATTEATVPETTAQTQPDTTEQVEAPTSPPAEQSSTTDPTSTTTTTSTTAPTTTTAPAGGLLSAPVVWTCTGSPCTWGSSLHGNAVVWPANLSPLRNRLGYTVSGAIYLPAASANGLTVTVVTGHAFVYAGSPDARSHRYLGLIGGRDVRGARIWWR